MKKWIIAIAFTLFAGVTFGQILKQGGILGVHNLELTPKTGVTMEELNNLASPSSVHTDWVIL